MAGQRSNERITVRSAPPATPLSRRRGGANSAAREAKRGEERRRGREAEGRKIRERRLFGRWKRRNVGKRRGWTTVGGVEARRKLHFVRGGRSRCSTFPSTRWYHLGTRSTSSRWKEPGGEHCRTGVRDTRVLAADRFCFSRLCARRVAPLAACNHALATLSLASPRLSPFALRQLSSVNRSSPSFTAILPSVGHPSPAKRHREIPPTGGSPIASRRGPE